MAIECTVNHLLSHPGVELHVWWTVNSHWVQLSECTNVPWAQQRRFFQVEFVTHTSRQNCRILISWNCSQVKRGAVSRGEKNNFHRTQTEKQFSVATPRKDDDFSKLKIRMEVAARTLLPRSPQPPSPPQPALLKCEQTLCCLSLANFDQRGVASLQVETRSGERDAGRRVVRRGGESPPVWECVPLAPGTLNAKRLQTEWSQQGPCVCRNRQSLKCPLVSPGILVKPAASDNKQPRAVCKSAVRRE